MHVVCTASIEDDRQRANLCDCVRILGGNPCVSGNTVCVEFHGPRATAEKFTELFEQYPTFEISYLRIQRR